MDSQRILKLIAKWLPWAIALLLGLSLASWCFRSVPPVRVRLITTTDTVYQNVPVVRDRLVDRIVYRNVAPDTIMVSQPHTDSVFIRYCEAVGASRDSSPPKPLLLLSAGRYDGARLDLWGPRTDGSSYHGAATLRPPFEFVASGDSVAFSQRRVGLIRLSLPQVTVSFAIGVLLGKALLH